MAYFGVSLLGNQGTQTFGANARKVLNGGFFAFIWIWNCYSDADVVSFSDSFSLNHSLKLKDEGDGINLMSGFLSGL